MSRVLDLAKEVKDQSRSFYEHFKSERNESYMAHMGVIFDSAEKVRYALEEDNGGTVPPDAWKAVLAIMHMGFSSEDYSEANESFVLSLYEKFALLEKSYKQVYETPNNSLQPRRP